MDGLSFGRVSTPRSQRLRAVGVVLLAAGLGPLCGLILALSGVVLGPPWVEFNGGVYFLLGWLGFPLSILAIFLRWIRVIGLTAALILTIMGSCFYLALIGPMLPTDMTTCQALPAPAPQVHYSCVSTSSDGPYHLEFELEGWKGWPVMHKLSAR